MQYNIKTSGDEVLFVEELKENEHSIINEIMEYEKEVFGEGAIDIWNIKPMIKYGKILVLYKLNKETQQKEIVSVCEIQPSFEKEKAYIYGFFTKGIFQKRGYGRIFLNFIHEYLCTMGIERIELTVDPENKGAINLYKKTGFIIEKELKNEYGNNNNRYLMIMITKMIDNNMKKV